ncbi:MAG: NADAR family protein [Sylvanvirus sp.]|uniref:NADAR family protein n=1 Tax=Sylvanvirus sp. TaxID=2487774 RepID=A0A3G5AIJ5_9VIRU|nr:MAG: NADAR family protein [Sylvanvirus sp.]
MSSPSDLKESLYFYGRTNENDPFKRNVFSNFEPSVFHEDSMQFVCSEQYLMYHKSLLFNDPDTASLVLNESIPSKIKAYGRQVKGFDEKIWKEFRFQIMVKGCYLKFSQNETLKEILLYTQDLELVEASPTDRIWGIGLDRKTAEQHGREAWKGLNLLGKALMVVRSFLMKEKIEQVRPSIDWWKTIREF